MHATHQRVRSWSSRSEVRHERLLFRFACRPRIYRRLTFQTPISEPVFEPDLSELRLVFGNKGPLTHTHSVIERIRIGDNLTRVTECAQAKTNQFVEAELLRASNLNYAVHRRSD